MRRALVIVGVLGLALAALVGTGAFRADSSSVATGGATSSGAPASTGAAPGAGGPAAVPEGALVLGAQASDLAVGLAVTREDGGVALEATVLGQDGLPAKGLDVAFETGGQTASATGCGDGCYGASLETSLPVKVSVTIEKRGKTRSASFDLPASWKPAAALVRKATRTYRGLSSIVYDERLESRPGDAIETRWVEEAPNRLSFKIANGNHGIVIGNRRWDRDPGGKWVESRQEPLSLPEPLWGETFQHASLIGSTEIKGRPAWIVSFMTTKGLPTWFTLWIDKETARPLELHMTTAAHFMVQRYVSYNEPVSIVPPT